MREIEITPQQAGQRLDRFLSRYLRKAGSGFLYRMLRKKNITLNGHKAQGSEKLSEGDVLRLFFADETLRKLRGDQEKEPGRGLPDSDGGIGRRILYEDEDILLADKPAGMLTQKARPGDVSLNEYIIRYLLDEGTVTEEDLMMFRPSVCNRLDRNTSGIVAAGKTVPGLQELSRLIRDRGIRKFYKAVVVGEVERAALIDGWLVKDTHTNTVRIVQNAEDGAQRIQTRYVPEQILRGKDGSGVYTLLEVELLTGRSHQIRAHLSSAGHPLAGDVKYGRPDVNDFVRRRYGVRRQLLHAQRLVFPETDGRLSRLSGRTFTAPLPEDFRRMLAETR